MCLALLMLAFSTILPCYSILRWPEVQDRPELFRPFGTDLEVMWKAGRLIEKGVSPFVPHGMTWDQYNPTQPYINYRYDIVVGELVAWIPQPALRAAEVALLAVLTGIVLLTAWLFVRTLKLMGFEGAEAYLPVLIAASPALGTLVYANIEPLLPLLVVIMLWATVREKPLAWVIGATGAMVLITKAPQFGAIWLFPLLIDRRLFKRAAVYGLLAYSAVTAWSILSVPNGAALYFDRFRFFADSFTAMPWSAYGQGMHALQEQSVLQSALNIFGPSALAQGVFVITLALVIANLVWVAVRLLWSDFSQRPKAALLAVLFVAMSVQACLWQVEYISLIPMVYVVLSLVRECPWRRVRFMLIPYTFYSVLVIAGVYIHETPLLTLSMLVSVILLTKALWALSGVGETGPSAAQLGTGLRKLLSSMSGPEKYRTLAENLIAPDAGSGTTEP